MKSYQSETLIFKKKSRKNDGVNDGGTTVFFVSHDMDQIKEMCNKVLWIEHGIMQKIGTTEEICKQYAGIK